MQKTKAIGMVAVLASAATALAQVDSAQVLLTQAQAAGSTSPSAPGLMNATVYDAASDTAYISVSTPADATFRIRRVTNVSTAPMGVSVITAAQLDTWLQRGEARTGVGFPSGLSFNPAPVGTVPTAGSIWVADNPGVSVVGGGVNDSQASLRVYRYNLQDVPTSFPTPYENVSQVLTPLLSKADKQVAATGTFSAANDASNRQLVFSPDAQWLYQLDSGSATGIPGIYRIDPINSGVVFKLTTPATTSVSSEPAVVKNGPLDRIYYRSSNNTNGLSFVDHNPSANTTDAETVALTGADLQSFLEVTAAPTVTNLTSDASGNIYFWVSTTSAANSQLLKLDGNGRLIKITTRAERAAVLGVPATGTGAASVAPSRMSSYSNTHPTAGIITRVVENEVIYGMTVANVFKPYDFDRDGDEDDTDLSAFKSKLTLRGVPSPIADARYDLNGNGAVDWKDVKIVQSFAGFLDGDANMSGIADISDFAALAANFNQTNMIWTQGDFTGDEIVNITDFALLAANFNVPTFQRGGAVPEPASALLAPTLTYLLRRRRGVGRFC